MTPLAVGLILFSLLLLLLIGGVWIAISLAAVAWFGLQFFTSTPPDVNLFQSFWGSSASWTLAALPMFVWMGEILYRTRLSDEMFEGLSPWLGWLPGRLMHVNILGCAIFGTVSGSSAATCATIAKVALPELKRRGYDEKTCLGSLAAAGTLGILLPPSIIMVVYAVAAEVSIIKVFLAGFIPGFVLTALFSGYIVIWALMNPEKTPPDEIRTTLREKLYRARHLVPCLALIVFIVWVMVIGWATATEAAAYGVLGALAIAEWVASLEPHKYTLIAVLAGIYILLGTALDGISMIVLTTSIVIPMVEKAGFDLVWFGIFIVLLVEIAELTPPLGFNIFVLQTMTGRDSNYVALASMPFFFMMVLCIAVITVFPELATWLPDVLIGA